jgi:acetylornithine deacetylase
MKGGLVTALTALRLLQNSGMHPGGDVWIQFVIGEETGGIGTLSTILNGYTADAAILLEPTELHLCPVGAGAASFRLHVQGLAAHGSMRKQGVSAIEKFAVIHRALLQLESDRNQAFHHPLFKGTLAAPISVGTIKAGDWPSSVPDSLVAEGRYGVLPGEEIRAARRKLETTVREIAAEDPWMRDHPPLVEWFEGQFEPAETPLDSGFIPMLQQSHQTITGSPLKMHGVPYGSDLRFFTNYSKIPAVLYGPGSVDQAHAANEFITLDDVFIASRITAAMIASWCGL